MQWIGKDKRIVLILSEDAILHRSNDNGKTFSNQMKKLQAVAGQKSKTVSGIRYMLASKADPLRVFFVGSEDSHFTTKDGGKTFQLVNSVVAFEDIKLHPEHAECMMAAQDTCSGGKSSQKPCYRKLWVSHDFGQSWSHVAMTGYSSLIGLQKYRKTYGRKIGNRARIPSSLPFLRKARRGTKI